MQLEDLVRRIRQGDKSAIKELVATYGNAVYQRALERTNDRDLAHEAARQTFGQFVAIVQQQPTEDGWSLWFGDLIERNITAYAQIGVDMGYIEDELENELYEEPSAVSEPEPLPPKTQPAARQPYAQAEPSPKTEAPRGKKSDRSDIRSLRDEVFVEAPAARRHKRKQGVTVTALIVVCLLLVWVVAGVAMTMKWIPYFDLGYAWFNASVFQLF